MGDFVTFEIAKKLKEKGFPIKTKTEGKWGLTELKEVDTLPTLYQVLKWLREEKGIHICISCSIAPLANWEYEIVEIDGVVFVNADDGYSTYEESALAGIEYALDNLI